jgi:hypothetical protein
MPPSPVILPYYRPPMHRPTALLIPGWTIALIYFTFFLGTFVIMYLLSKP